MGTNRWVIVFAVLSIPVLFGSCELLGRMRGTTHLNFSVAAEELSAVRTKSRSETIPASLPPNEIFWVNLSNQDEQPLRQALIPGDNQIELLRDSVYLVALTYNPTLDPEDALTEHIVLLGNVSVESLDLDSIPVSEDAAAEVDLGPLDVVADEFSSPATPDSLSADLGYDLDVLRGIGEFDATLKKFLNPDVNRDGIYDYEQGLDWWFRCYYTADIDSSLVDFAAGEVSATEASFSIDPTYYVGFFGGLSDVPASETEITLNCDSLETGYVTDIATATIEHTDSSQIALYLDVTRQNDLAPPYNGAYELNLGAETIWFDNVLFLKPSATLEGYVLPICELEHDGGLISVLNYQLMTMRNEMFVPLAPGVMDIRYDVSAFYISVLVAGLEYGMWYSEANGHWQLAVTDYTNPSVIHSESTFDAPIPAEQGTLDLTQFGLDIADVDGILVALHDLAGNMFEVRYWQ